jgi:hypothetical protein
MIDRSIDGCLGLRLKYIYEESKNPSVLFQQWYFVGGLKEEKPSAWTLSFKNRAGSNEFSFFFFIPGGYIMVVIGHWLEPLFLVIIVISIISSSFFFF